MCKVYTDVDDIRHLYHECPPVLEIIDLLKLLDYLHVQGGQPMVLLLLILLNHWLVDNAHEISSLLMLTNQGYA